MSKTRTVNLFCPSVSKLTQLVAWEEQKLDLGSIAGAFGLDPPTVKLNGHFLSRGLDLVSSCVTWRSLLKFFSAKGLTTGKDNKDAIIIDGKLCKVGRKRSHESEEEIAGKIVALDISICQTPSFGGINLVKNKKLRESNSGCEERDGVVSISNAKGFKRKRSISLQDLSFLKKLESSSGNSFGFDTRDASSNNCSVAPFQNAIT